MNESASVARVEAIFIAPTAGAEVQELVEAEFEAGAGLRGDRYHKGAGTFSPETMGPDHQLTLIEAEKIDAFLETSGLTLGHGAFRRNVVTRGVDLNALVGSQFRIGSVLVRGMRLCEPCSHLAGMLSDQVLRSMVHQAGLRAEILSGGTARAGDPIEIL